MTTPRQLGTQYETRAQHYLEQRGLTTVTKNYAATCGEIDLIMREQATLVFVEVRYRRSPAFGGALNSLSSAKRNRLINMAQRYMVEHSHTGAVRFDLIAFEGENTRPVWVRNAFTTTDEAIF